MHCVCSTLNPPALVIYFMFNRGSISKRIEYARSPLYIHTMRISLYLYLSFILNKSAGWREPINILLGEDEKRAGIIFPNRLEKKKSFTKTLLRRWVSAPQIRICKCSCTVNHTSECKAFAKSTCILRSSFLYGMNSSNRLFSTSIGQNCTKS